MKFFKPKTALEVAQVEMEKMQNMFWVQFNKNELPPEQDCILVLMNGIAVVGMNIHGELSLYNCETDRWIGSIDDDVLSGLAEDASEMKEWKAWSWTGVSHWAKIKLPEGY